MGSSSTSEVFFCGDLHGRFTHLAPAVQMYRPLALVLLGDMTPAQSLEDALQDVLSEDVPVYWIPGNHDADDDESWLRVWGSKLEAQNIHGRVIELPNGLRLAGLGGVFRAAVWHPASQSVPMFRTMREHAEATPRQERWQGSGPHRKHWGTVYPEALEHLAKQRADVLVTHEAPGYHPHGFGVLDELARQLGVHTALHGHHHDALDSSAAWQAQGFKSYGVGLCGITALDGEGRVMVRVPGAFDAHSMRR